MGCAGMKNYQDEILGWKIKFKKSNKEKKAPELQRNARTSYNF